MHKNQTVVVAMVSWVSLSLVACTKPAPSQVSTLIDSGTAKTNTIPPGGTTPEPIVLLDGTINELQQGLPTNTGAQTNPLAITGTTPLAITAGPATIAIVGNWNLTEVDCLNPSNNALVTIPASVSGTTDTYNATLVTLGSNFTLTLSITASGATLNYTSKGCTAYFPLAATFPATDQVTFAVGSPNSNPPGCANAPGTAILSSSLGTPISTILQGTFNYTMDTSKALLTRSTSGMGLCSAIKNVNGKDVLYFTKQ
jgi:hypothetical protein